MWFHAAELRVWEAHRAKMVFLCLGARIAVGCLSALIGPDGRPRCPSSVPLTFPQRPLYHHASVASCQSSHQDRLHHPMKIVSGGGVGECGWAGSARIMCVCCEGGNWHAYSLVFDSLMPRILCCRNPERRAVVAFNESNLSRESSTVCRARAAACLRWEYLHSERRRIRPAMSGAWFGCLVLAGVLFHERGSPGGDEKILYGTGKAQQTRLFTLQPRPTVCREQL